MPTPKVTYNDLGPALDAICEKKYGETWETFDMATKAHVKNQVLDLVLPGFTALIESVNEQLEAIDRAQQPS